MNLILTVIGYSNYLSHTRGVVVCAFQGIDSFHLSYQIYVCRVVPYYPFDIYKVWSGTNFIYSFIHLFLAVPTACKISCTTTVTQATAVKTSYPQSTMPPENAQKELF